MTRAARERNDAQWRHDGTPRDRSGEDTDPWSDFVRVQGQMRWLLTPPGAERRSAGAEDG
ncbi:hypothetical protein ABZY31_05190 [Streptomyces sp. NPDC006529]|uniref:hypothetical protein n=1 Tax=Streptomyces sp. NPDC006529 TaxID=3157177 RepID=UPI0033BBF111